MESLLPYKDICDADITGIEQCAEGIKLHITNVVHDDAYYNVVLALFADSCDVNYYYCKQYPRCHSIRFRGREADFKKMQKHLEKSGTMMIMDNVMDTDRRRILLACELRPFQGGGKYRQIIIDIQDLKRAQVLSEEITGEYTG